MIKMPCLFQRDFSDKKNPLLMNIVTSGCEWVLNGEGKASRKYDGTAVMILNNLPYARYDAKKGKIAPRNAIPCCEPDEVTDHHPHWIPVDEKQHKYIIEAFNNNVFEDGTYECIGEKINNNREKIIGHQLIKHGDDLIIDLERTYDGIFNYLKNNFIEGIVFNHEDGRFAKIRRNDYRLEWK